MTVPIISNNGEDGKETRFSGMTLPRVVAGTSGGWAFALYAARVEDLTRTPPNPLEAVRLAHAIVEVILGAMIRGIAQSGKEGRV